MNNGNGNGNGLTALGKYWQFFFALAGIVALFVRLETKVDAMEPLAPKVEQLQVEQAAIQSDIKWMKRNDRKEQKETQAFREKLWEKLEDLNDKEEEDN